MAWTRKLPSGRWQGYYRDPTRKIRRASERGTFVRKSDASTAAQEQERAIRHGNWTDPSLAKMLFSAWAPHWLAMNLHQRPTTRARDESYVNVHLMPAFGHMSLGGIEPIDIQDFVAKLAPRRAPATVAIAHRLMASIMASAEASGYISRSPCRGVKLPRIEQQEMRFLSATELERLAQTVPERFRALVLTTGYIGLRWGEAAGLKRSRLNLLKAKLEVAEILTEARGTLAFGEPKTKASRRTLTLPAFLVEELASHLEQHSTSPELIFAGRDGAPLRRNNFRRRVWLPATQRAGLGGLRFHDLRHTAASLLIAQNVHPKVIQARLGHSSIGVTLDRYGHLLPNLDAEVADGLEEHRNAALSENPAAHLLHGGDGLNARSAAQRPENRT